MITTAKPPKARLNREEREYLATVLIPWTKRELEAEDGEPLETFWHYLQIGLLVDIVEVHLRPREDYFAGGNMFIYFNGERGKKRRFRGPDFFFAEGVRHDPLRPYWCVWEENGQFPKVIIELASPTTAKADRTVKKEVYEQVFRTPEFYIYDPRTQTLEGWWLRRGKYAAIEPDAEGRLRCEALDAWLGGWHGEYKDRTTTWLRLFDAEGRVLPTREEEERSTAEAERERAAAEASRAAAEASRADAAEAEVARLKAELAQARKNGRRNGRRA